MLDYYYCPRSFSFPFSIYALNPSGICVLSVDPIRLFPSYCPNISYSMVHLSPLVFNAVSVT